LETCLSAQGARIKKDKNFFLFIINIIITKKSPFGKDFFYFSGIIA